MIIRSLRSIFGWSNFSRDSKKIVDGLDITPSDKLWIMRRYVSRTLEAEKDIYWIKKSFNSLNLWVTIGGVILASLILLKGSSYVNDTGKEVLYWVNWILALTISIANKSISLFKLDAKYIMGTAYVEKLKTEGWQFFELSGKYKDCLTHSEALQKFGTRVERLIINATSDDLGLDDDNSDRLFASVGLGRSVYEANQATGNIDAEKRKSDANEVVIEEEELKEMMKLEEKEEEAIVLDNGE